MAFEKGNKLGQKSRIWDAEVRKVIIQNPEKLREAALALVNAASEGDMLAIKELGDRLDGKSTQHIQAQVEHTVSTGDEATLGRALEDALRARGQPTVQ